MVKDRLVYLEKYYGLDERLKQLSSYRETPYHGYREFHIDKDATNLFVAEEGNAVAATGWRENRENREVTGAVTMRKGEFCLFLPGEPMAVTKEKGAAIKHWRLK